jgi:hypothetical protein
VTTTPIAKRIEDEDGRVRYRINPTAAAKLEYSMLSKNLCHRPITRSRAATPFARKSQKGDRWLIDLHPDDGGAMRTRLYIEASIDDPRALSVGDMEVLLRLTAMVLRTQEQQIHDLVMAEVQQSPIPRRRRRSKQRIAATMADERLHDHFIAMHQDIYKPGFERQAMRDLYKERAAHWKKRRQELPPITLEFATTRAMVVAFGRNANTPSNAEALYSSLTFLRRVSFLDREWYEDRKTEKRIIGPLIEWLRTNSEKGPVRVRLSPSYIETVRGFFIRPQLPIRAPFTSAAALNLDHLVRAHSRKLKYEDEPDGLRWKREVLANCIGLLQEKPSKRMKRLAGLIKALNARPGRKVICRTNNDDTLTLRFEGAKRASEPAPSKRSPTPKPQAGEDDEIGAMLRSWDDPEYYGGDDDDDDDDGYD